MKKLNNKGFGAVEVLIIVVIVVLIGLVGWLVYDRQNSKTDATTTNNTTSNDSAKTNNDEQKAGYITINEWGVQFEVPSSIPDLKVDSFTDYPAEGDTAASSVVVLDSPELEAAGKIKQTGTQERHEKLGQIVRQKNNSVYYGNSTIEDYAAVNNFAGVKIGDYYYVYITTYASDNAENYLNSIKASIESSLESTN